MNVQSGRSRKHCLASRFHIKINDYSFFVEGFCRCSISGHNNILICLDIKNKALLSVLFLFNALRLKNLNSTSSSGNFIHHLAPSDQKFACDN